MNQFNHDNLSFILRDPAAWDTIRDGRQVTGHEPKMQYIHTQMRIAKEVHFYDEVYFPYLARYMARVKRWNIFPNVEWEQVQLGYATPITVWMTSDSDLQDVIADRIQFCLEPAWYSEEWGHEHISQDDVLALGVRPDNLGAIQERLF